MVLGRVLDCIHPDSRAIMIVKSMKAVIITENARYEKELTMNYWTVPIWKICTETMNQLTSEQYILAKGFKKCE